MSSGAGALSSPAPAIVARNLGLAYTMRECRGSDWFAAKMANEDCMDSGYSSAAISKASKSLPNSPASGKREEDAGCCSARSSSLSEVLSAQSTPSASIAAWVMASSLRSHHDTQSPWH